MRKTCLCLLAWSAFMRAAAADDAKQVSWQRSPRRLMHEINAKTWPVSWGTLVFSGDGKTLAGAGEKSREESAASGPRSAPPTDHIGLIELWDLKTYRPTKAEIPFRITGFNDDMRLQFALRLTDNGKVAYGNLQTSQTQAEVLDKMTEPQKLALANGWAEYSGIYQLGPNQSRPELIKAQAPTGLFFLGSHLSPDGRRVLLATPEGLQNCSIEMQTKVDQAKNNQPAEEDEQAKPTPAGRQKKPGKGGAKGKRQEESSPSAGAKMEQLLRDGRLPKTNAAKRPTPKPPVAARKLWQAKPQGPLIAAPSRFQTPSFFSPDGSCFVAVEGAGGMVVWNVQQKKVRCRTNAPADGRAEVAAISRDAQRLFVASAANPGTIYIYDAGNGSKIAQIGPLNGSVTSLSASSDGNSLAYCAGGLAYVRDSLNNKEAALPLEKGDCATCVAISPDGLSAAVGGDDGAVRLWEAVPPRQGLTAQKPADTDAPLVALGPRRVTVTGAKGETQEMWLVRLTPSVALLRRTLGGKLLRVPAANGKVTRLAADGAAWQLDAKQNRYVGPVAAPTDLPAIDVAARPASSDEENLHLLLGARRRLSALIGMIEQPGNEESIRGFRQSAERLERYLQGKPAAGSAIAAVYGDLARAADELSQSAAGVRKTLDALNQQAIDAAKQQSRGSDRAALDRMLGLGMVLLGSVLTERRFVSTFNNPAGGYGPVYVQEVMLFPELVQAGVLRFLGGSASTRQRQAQLKAAQQLAENDSRKALVAALELRESAIKRVQDRWHGVAMSDFGLDADPPPPEDLPRKSRRAADLQPLVDALTEQMRRDRGRTNRDDPFQFADVLFLKSLVRESAETDAGNVFRRAREVAALVPQVPPGDIHNADRATLLSLAATLLSRAVALESGDCDPAEAYSEKAAYAAALLDRALTLEPDDPTGRLGEQRALALAQCGHSGKALEQARQVVAKHPDSASAHYLLARLECSAGDLNAGFDRLERALVKHGLRDLNDVGKRPEFPKNDDRFKELTELHLKVFGVVGLSGVGRVAVFNAGAFPLYDVSFRLQYRGTSARSKGPAPFVVETGLRRLAPGETYVLFTEQGVTIEAKKAKSGKPQPWPGGKVTVTAAQQGAAECPIVAVPLNFSSR